uniref:Uncharacterized protein n=1 Tax=Panagrellus redivivus TaxID=6233 RepID=A0A7E4V0F4_PANRE
MQMASSHDHLQSLQKCVVILAHHSTIFRLRPNRPEKSGSNAQLFEACFSKASQKPMLRSFVQMPERHASNGSFSNYLDAIR